METVKKKDKKSLRIQNKINRTTKKIEKERNKSKATTIVKATDLEEIHKLLSSSDDNLPTASSSDSFIESTLAPQFKFGAIPIKTPLVSVFEKPFIFSLFTEKDCFLKNFIQSENEETSVFGEKVSELSENSFRKFLRFQPFKIFKEEEKCASIGLYVLHLMSVHQDHNLVSACFEFLIQNPFVIQPEDIFLIFTNFGVDKNLFPLNEEKFFEKFPKRNGDVGAEAKHWLYNIEMVGRLLIHYITRDLIAVNPNVQFLIAGLLRITLDPIIFNDCLLAPYSTLLTILCLRVKDDFKLNEIASWLYLKEEHLLIQVEVCRIVAKSIFPNLHEVLVQKTIEPYVGFGNILFRSPIKIDYPKLVLKKLKDRELSALELYSVLQLVNSLLPGFTATVEDSTEIKKSLACLELKITKWTDPVDLVRLKLEIAKLENFVTYDVFNEVVASGSSSAKRFKCSN